MPTEREVFARLFKTGPVSEGQFLEYILILGQLTFYKFDKVESIEIEGGKILSSDVIQSIADEFTERQIEDFRKNAQSSLSEYRARNRSTAFWYGVWQNLTATFLYSLLIVVFALILKYSGKDLVDFLGLR